MLDSWKRRKESPAYKKWKKFFTLENSAHTFSTKPPLASGGELQIKEQTLSREYDEANECAEPCSKTEGTSYRISDRRIPAFLES
ncbi:hypothetical protein TNCV_984651 [Trichonephila clavipes]|nr:hypothetical protein TNCV_984651 [Trichonephila clavipes]